MMSAHPFRLGMRLLPAALLAASVCALLTACREEDKLDVAKGINPEAMATMTTTNVSTLISDSGITQYKIVSPIWYVYDETDTPMWRFPKGLYLRKFDRKLKTIASVAADSATYFRLQRLWRLDGNVEMHRGEKEIFLTQQLFWNERTNRIYSDSFIHIETATHVLEGHGFISNGNLTNYRVVRPTGIFPLHQEQEPGKGGAQTASPSDSAPQYEPQYSEPRRIGYHKYREH